MAKVLRLLDMTRHGRKFLLGLFSTLFRDPKYCWLEGLFELKRSPSRALNLDAYLASELQRYKDIDMCGVPGTKVTGHRQEQLTQTWIVRL